MRGSLLQVGSICSRARRSSGCVHRTRQRSRIRGERHRGFLLGCNQRDLCLGIATAYGETRSHQFRIEGWFGLALSRSLNGRAWFPSAMMLVRVRVARDHHNRRTPIRPTQSTHGDCTQAFQAKVEIEIVPTFRESVRCKGAMCPVGPSD